MHIYIKFCSLVGNSAPNYDAVTDHLGASGVSCFIVPKESDGLTFGAKEEKVSLISF